MSKQDAWLPPGWPDPTDVWGRPKWAVELDGLKHLQRELTAADVEATESWQKLYNAEVGFCGNVPLNITQQNQYLFTSMAARIKYVKAKMRLKANAPNPSDYDNSNNYFIYNNTSQIRTNGTLLIGTAVRNLEACNYMFFHNKYEENSDVERQKWYFCFILRTEYIAPNTCAVYYHIDPFMTYLHDLEIKPSYIERMTPDNDYLFENTVEEALPPGPTKVTKYFFLPINTLNFSGVNIPKLPFTPLIPAANQTWVQVYYYTNPTVGGTTIGNNKLWLPFERTYFEPNQQAEMRSFFEQQGHTVFAGYLVPAWMLQLTNYQGDWTLNWSFNTGDNEGEFIDLNYKPKNKKLYTYPYTYMEVLNNLGASMELRWEGWDNYDAPGVRKCQFHFNTAFALTPECNLFPYNYLGESSLQNSQINLPYNDFPTVPWTSDAFNAWYASNSYMFKLENYARKEKARLNQIQESINAVNPLAYIGKATGLGGDIMGLDYANIDNYVAQNYEDRFFKDLLNTADTVGGYQPGSLYNYLNDRMGYTFRIKTITREFAWKIDSYFTQRGYAYRAVRPVTLMTKRGYKYIEAPKINIVVKNDGLERGVPNPAIHEIAAAFAAGITFWNPPVVTPGVEPDDTIGNYGEWLPDPLT